MSRASSAATSPAPTSRRHIASSRAETYTPQIVNNEGLAEGLVAPISTTYCSEDHAYSSDAHDEAEKPRTRHVRRANTLSKDYEDEEEKAVVKKFDRRLTLLLAFLYLLSFLDRSNIGNARIAGLEEALQLSDREFDYCLVAFYITYIAFEWMILLYRLVPAHIYISLCVLAWGVVASLQSVVTSFSQLRALRACLGVTEAAFGPGVPFYMTFFYRREELAYRVGLQISAAPLATSFASGLAWIIVKLNQNGPIEPWRALFLFEGFPSIITAIFVWYLIPDSPDKARYLNARERKVARLRLKDEQHLEDSTIRNEHKPLSSNHLLSRLTTSKTFKTLSSSIAWLQALIFLSINVSFASLPVFLPTVIRSMQFSALTSQILSAPPYLFSFAFVLLIGRFSDSVSDSRGYCLMACSGISATSYFLTALSGHLEATNTLSEGTGIIVRYVAVYGAAMGLFSSVVLIITWNLNNQPSRKEKGLAMMIMNVVGQCGPLIGVNLFPKRDGPYYVTGMLVSGFFMSGVVLLSAILRWKLQKMNGQGSSGSVYEMVPMTISDSRSEEAENLMAHNTNDNSILSTGQAFRYML
ncbi:hypothetical protein LTR64_003565 [Lithohypha guttulata]|uniref:uncharacterized protein n=1 Tax=Lithohypha guttulata TaxID=1690604 RepID=UPI002DDF08B7|nr:hypothetical protein LTR51_000215 [Lithohypha guttulata]